MNIYSSKVVKMVLFVITIFIFLMIVGLVYNFFFKNIEGNTVFNPTCSGSGWTDPNPASNGRHFSCDGKGNYLAAPGGFCPSNFQNKNGTCVNPSGPAPFTSKCTGNGWTDPNPASNGRHFSCDGKGNYLAAPGGFCPSNFQNKNGTCFNPGS